MTLSALPNQAPKMQPAPKQTIIEQCLKEIGLNSTWFCRELGISPVLMASYVNGTKQTPRNILSYIAKIKVLLRFRTAELEKRYIELKTNNIVVLQYSTDKDFWMFERTYNPLPCTFYDIASTQAGNNLKKMGYSVQFVKINAASYLTFLASAKQDTFENKIRWAEEYIKEMYKIAV